MQLYPWDRLGNVGLFFPEHPPWATYKPSEIVLYYVQYKKMYVTDLMTKKLLSQEQTLFEDLRHGYECRKKENLEIYEKLEEKGSKGKKDLKIYLK